MKKHILFLTLLYALIGCGGGAGSVAIATSVKADPSSISFIAGVGATRTSKEIKYSVANPPSNGLYINLSIEKEGSSIREFNFYEVSNEEGIIRLEFESRTIMGVGQFSNQIKMNFCLDQDCQNHILGSPLLIDTTLLTDRDDVIVGNGEVSINQSVISVESNRENNWQAEKIQIPIIITDANIEDLHFDFIEEDPDEISRLSMMYLESDLNFSFEYRNSSDAGDYSSSYDVSVCYDSFCHHHLKGSPLKIDVNFHVTN